MKTLLALLLFASLTVSAKTVTKSTVIETYVLYDADSHTLIDAKNHHEIHAIASLTKLMTAMVAIDNGNNNASLIGRLLIKSDNVAADEIANQYPGGRFEFVKAMNNKASQLGLFETVYHDPSGLSVFNRSTAKEYVDVILEAEKYPLIKYLSSLTETTVDTNKRKKYTIRNTNNLLREYTNITLSKTGFTSHAGRCLAMVVEGLNTKHVIVIMGHQTPESRARLARELIGKIQ